MKLLPLLLALGTIFSVQAEECSHIYTPHHLFNEAMKRNIHLELKDLQNKALEGQIVDAEKIYNPEFEHFTTSGNQLGRNNITSESRIWFNLQLNNKRAKKGRVAQTDKEIGLVELEILRLQLKQEIFLATLRFKQIKREIGAVENLTDVVENFIQRYKKVGFLTPQQRVEVGSLELSSRDLEMRKASLQNETDLILRLFQKMTGESCDVNVNLSENGENEWPDLDGFQFRPDQALSFKIDQLALKKSQFEFEREESKKVPDLKIGPVWQLNKLGNQEYNIFGVGLIIPMPFFDRNQGLRTSAEFNMKRAERYEEYRRVQRQKEFDFRVDSYLRLLAKIKGNTDLEEYNKLTNEYKRLFLRGLITTSSFLTYKRELLNLTFEVHQIENALASHLLELYRLNNQTTDGFLEKVLKL